MARGRTTGGDATQVKALVDEFWGRSSGEPTRLAAVCDAAREARLSRAQLRMIRASVPLGQGITAERCARVREVLADLAEEGR